MEFETELRGQIVVVRVLFFRPAVPGNRCLSSHPDNWYPEEPESMDWELLSEDGEELDWLLDASEIKEIDSEVYFVMMDEIERNRDNPYED